MNQQVDPERAEWIKKFHRKWKKPQCPFCEPPQFLNRYDHGEGGEPDFYQCWGCGAIVQATLIEDPTDQPRPTGEEEV